MWEKPDHEGKGKKVKLSLCLTKHHAMKTYWGSGGISPRILEFGTRWKWVVSFTPWSLYPQGKSPCFPLDSSVGGPQSCSGCGDEEKNSQPPPGIEPWNPNRPARSPVLYHKAIVALNLTMKGLTNTQKVSIMLMQLTCFQAGNLLTWLRFFTIFFRSYMWIGVVIAQTGIGLTTNKETPSFTAGNWTLAIQSLYWFELSWTHGFPEVLYSIVSIVHCLVDLANQQPLQQQQQGEQHDSNEVIVLTSSGGSGSKVGSTYKLRDSRIIEIAGGRELFSQSRSKAARCKSGRYSDDGDKLGKRTGKTQGVWELRTR
jgi:hypothetical protein